MMTKEQIAKLQNIMRIAEVNDYQTIIDLCNEIMLVDTINEQKKFSKFNLYNYVAKDILRQIMCGVYYNNGEAVASDSHILVVLKNQIYDKKYEGKSIKQDGTLVEGIYPKYNNIKPMNCTKHIKINFDKFDQILQEDKAKVKLMSKDMRKGYQPIIKVDDILYRLDYFRKFVDFMKHIEVDYILVNENEEDAKRYPAIVENKNGWGLLMPLSYGKSCYEL